MKDAWTALMYAALAGYAAVAELLLQEGADPRATDKVSDLPVVFVLAMSVTRHCCCLSCRNGGLLETWLIMTP